MKNYLKILLAKQYYYSFIVKNYYDQAGGSSYGQKIHQNSIDYTPFYFSVSGPTFRQSHRPDCFRITVPSILAVSMDRFNTIMHIWDLSTTEIRRES